MAELTTETDRITEQRRKLPDAPGVYLFHDRKGKVLYVGKASVDQEARGVALLDAVDARREWACSARSTGSSSSSPRPRRRRCSPSRTSSASTARASTCGCATTSRTRTSRSRSTRTSRACTSRASGTAAGARTSGRSRTPSGCATRSTCSGRSSSSGPATAPSRAARRGRPAWTTSSSAAGRPASATSRRRSTAKSIDSIISFLSGRYRHIERELEQQMQAAAREQEFEQAALYRNRLKSVRTLLERQRISNAAVGTVDVVAVAVDGADANAQVFQVRDGVLADRQSFYLEVPGERSEGEVAEEFVVQYYATSPAIPPQVIVPVALEHVDVLARGAGGAARDARRGPPRRARRQAPHLRAGRAQRAAGARPGPAALRAPAHPADRRAGAAADGARHGSDPDADRVLRHLQPGGDAHGRLDGRVRGRRAEEVRLPAVRDPRRGAGRLRGDERGAVAADGAVRRAARAVAARARLRRVVRLRAGADRDRRRQGAALVRPGGARAVHRPGRRRSCRWPSGSRRCSCPAAARRS